MKTERQAGPISAGEIRRTYQRIRAYLRRTPTLTVPLAALTGAGRDDAGPGVVLKLEQLQCAGSFKARGAFANLLLREIPPAGVIAASGGNHGVAVAYAAHRLEVPAAIFVPAIAGRAKTDAIRSLGADLHIGGDRYADAWAAAQAWAAESGAMQVPAFDQRETILGQGSVGLELSEQVSDLDTVLAPVGGGGLIAGIAAYFTGAVRIIGVEPDGPPAASPRTCWPPGESATWYSPSPSPTSATSSSSATRQSARPSTRCGAPPGWSPNPPRQSQPRRSSPAPTAPNPANASPSSSRAPTPRWPAE